MTSPACGAPRQATEQTERFLNALIENIRVSIIVKEPLDRRYVLINRAAEELYGYRAERVIGKTPDELFAKPTADLIRANDEQSRISAPAFSFIPARVKRREPVL